MVPNRGIPKASRKHQSLAMPRTMQLGGIMTELESGVRRFPLPIEVSQEVWAFTLLELARNGQLPKMVGSVWQDGKEVSEFRIEIMGDSSRMVAITTHLTTGKVTNKWQGSRDTFRMMTKMLSGRRTYADGRTRTAFEAISQITPTPDDVAEWQIELFYHPNGYSGPWDVRTVPHEGKFKTTWKCAGTCD